MITLWSADYVDLIFLPLYLLFITGYNMLVFDKLSLSADKLKADFVFVYTNTGQMASLMSGCRPDCPIFSFTPSEATRRRLNLLWGVVPFCCSFTSDMENNLSRSFSLLKARGMIKSRDLVIVVSDMLQSVQVINVP